MFRPLSEIIWPLTIFGAYFVGAISAWFVSFYRLWRHEFEVLEKNPAPSKERYDKFVDYIIQNELVLLAFKVIFWPIYYIGILADSGFLTSLWLWIKRTIIKASFSLLRLKFVEGRDSESPFRD